MVTKSFSGRKMDTTKVEGLWLLADKLIIWELKCLFSRHSEALRLKISILFNLLLNIEL